MKLLYTLTVVSSLALTGIFFLSRHPVFLLSSTSTVMNLQTANCNRDPIRSNLRIWLDPIPRSPSGQGALPPGTHTPIRQAQDPETHALNLELFLENNSENQQAVRVLSWRWHQGEQTQQLSWNSQPEMSPLNRYTQVQRHLVKLNKIEAIRVEMALEINGQYCHLNTQGVV